METLFATDGRVLGKAGESTRAALLDALGVMLESSLVADLHAMHVARAAGVSPATFYQYFYDIDDALAAFEASAQAGVRVRVYRPRAHPVRAVRWDGENTEAVAELAGGDGFHVLSPEERETCADPEATAVIKADGRARLVRCGWWVVRTGTGEVRVLADTEFRAAYEIAGAAPGTDGP